MKTAWKSLRKNCKSENGNQEEWKIGKWYRVDGDLEMCSHGFHASEYIPDAMSYIPTEVLAKVEVRGDSIEYPNKECWAEMRVIEAWAWEKRDAVELSVYAASLALENIKYPDNRIRNAIESAKNWLNLNKQGEEAAWSAAWSIESAARAAWYAEIAARSAEDVGSTESAAWSAAQSAAKSAQSAAESTARNAAWDAAQSVEWSAESSAQANSCKEAWNVESAAKKKIKIKCHNWVRRRLKKKER